MTVHGIDDGAGRPGHSRLASCVCSVAIAVAAVVVASQAAAAAGRGQDRYDPDCKPMSAPGRHGPYDYRSQSAEQRDLVARYHFTEHHAAYLQGKSQFQNRIDSIYETPGKVFA